jgi:hypothetical protein
MALVTSPQAATGRILLLLVVDIMRVHANFASSRLITGHESFTLSIK